MICDRFLTNYHPSSGQPYLFPGRFNGYLDPDSADKALRKAMKRVGLIGVSSHSFRRTALTQMSNNGTPLRVIQEVSGHRNLEQLQVYIEVRDEQVLGAVTGLSMLSPLPDSGIYRYPGISQTSCETNEFDSETRWRGNTLWYSRQNRLLS
jgi:integrase/recombinase XerD